MLLTWPGRRGSIFFAGFGTLWLCIGLAAMHRLNLVSGIVAAVVLPVLVIPAVRVLRATSGAPQGRSGT